MIFNYYMTRYSQASIYTFEFIFSIIVFLLVLLIYLKEIDKKSLWVFIITTLTHSTLELIGQGIGLRVITGATLFSIEIGYPFICFIQGAFEGGVISLAAFQVVLILQEKSKLASMIFIILTVGLLIGFFLNAVISNLNPESLETPPSLTKREIFSLASIFSLIILISVPILYTFLYKRFDPKDRKLLLYFYLGLSIYTIFIVIPNHIIGVRFIEVKVGDTFIKANLLEQILIMYIYNGCFESGGFLLAYFIPIHYFNLIGKKKAV